MSVEHFIRYAAAFEEAFTSRDFSILEPYFTVDASYTIVRPDGTRIENSGRESIFGYMEWITAEFDLKFAKRQIVRIEGPLVEGASVEVHGAACYTLESRRHCYLTMSETAYFRGDRIERLVDHITPGGQCEIEAMVETHPEIFSRAVLENRPSHVEAGGRP